MKIAFIAPISFEKTSGPKNSVTLLAKYLKRAGCDVDVYSDAIRESFNWNTIQIKPFKDFDSCDVDVVVFNGVYNYSYIICILKLIICRVNFLLSPRSSLMRMSFNKSRLKKKVFLLLFGYFLRKAYAVHFLTLEEKLSSILSGASSFVCGNIVDNFPSEFNENKKKIIRYLGRFDINHKGLDVFIDAISISSESIREHGWTVHLHGPEFMDGKNFLKKRVNDLKLNDIVFFHDAAYGADKDLLLDESSIFVHTSRYEGQPQAVMESMAFGNALLVTPGTNMTTIVKEANCGIVCEFNSINIADSIVSLISPSNVNLKSLQLGSFNYASEYFSGVVVASCFIRNLNALNFEKK